MLNDWDPPFTWHTASVRPCVGRTEPTDSGIQSTASAKIGESMPAVSAGSLLAAKRRPQEWRRLTELTLVLHDGGDGAMLLRRAPQLRL